MKARHIFLGEVTLLPEDARSFEKLDRDTLLLVCDKNGRWHEARKRALEILPELPEVQGDELTISEMVSKAHRISREKGWYDGVSSENPRNLGEMLALIHSEVSEALECVRDGKDLTRNETVFKTSPSPRADIPEGELICQNGETYFRHHLGGDLVPVTNEQLEYWYGLGKPVGMPSELADILIRVADLAGYLGIDLTAAVIEKMRYNSTRQHRHGGKVC